MEKPQGIIYSMANMLCHHYAWFLYIIVVIFLSGFILISISKISFSESKHLHSEKDIFVVIAHYEENISWLASFSFPYVVINNSGIEGYPKNKGREALSYLNYIVDNYHSLHSITIFAHAHQTSWHSLIPLSQTLKNLSYTRGYFNFNALSFPKGKALGSIRGIDNELDLPSPTHFPGST